MINTPVQQKESPPPPPKEMENNSPQPHDDTAPPGGHAQETTPGAGGQRQIHETNVYVYVNFSDQSEKSTTDDILGYHDGKSEEKGGYTYNNNNNNQEQQTALIETQEGGDEIMTEGNEGDNLNSQHQGGTGTAGDHLEKEKRVITETNDEGTDDVEPVDTTITIAAAAGGGIDIGTSSANLISYRKRGRDGNPILMNSTTSGRGTNKPRNSNKKEEVERPSCPPTCYVCKKPFGSWKAVFGHLRAHPRPTPGAFPPPTFTPPKGSPEKGNDIDNGNELALMRLREQLAPTLLNLARQTMVNNTTTIAPVASSSPSSTSGFICIDLNEPTTSVLLDLNEPTPPPPEKEDDIIDEDDHQN